KLGIPHPRDPRNSSHASGGHGRLVDGGVNDQFLVPCAREKKSIRSVFASKRSQSGIVNPEDFQLGIDVRHAGALSGQPQSKARAAWRGLTAVIFRLRLISATATTLAL